MSSATKPWTEGGGIGTWSLIIVISMQMGAPMRVHYLRGREIVQNVREAYRRSQILIVPSSLPVTSHFPSLWKQTAVILELWPSKVTT